MSNHFLTTQSKGSAAVQTFNDKISAVQENKDPPIQEKTESGFKMERECKKQCK